MISYGAREVSQAYSTCRTTKIDETPFAEFTFKYRSRGMWAVRGRRILTDAGFI